MSSPSFHTLPRSTEAHRNTHATSHSCSVKVVSPPSTPSKSGISHLGPSYSSVPSLVAHKRLETRDSPLSPAGSRVASVRPKTYAKKSTSSYAPLALRSHTPPTRSSSDNLTERDSADYLPAGFEILPQSCYNYQPFVPPPPPPVLPRSREWLYNQLTNINLSIFLSCNLRNPVHLASIIAYGCKWSVVESIAENMASAVHYVEETGEPSHKKSVDGVLLAGLMPETTDLLETYMRSKYGEQYHRRVDAVRVDIEDGGVARVAAYVYQKA